MEGSSAGTGDRLHPRLRAVRCTQARRLRSRTQHCPCPLPTEFSTLRAVQATMILSTILCCISFLVFLLQLFRLKQGERFVLTSIIQLMSCKWQRGAGRVSTLFLASLVWQVRTWQGGGRWVLRRAEQAGSVGQERHPQDMKPELASVVEWQRLPAVQGKGTDWLQSCDGWYQELASGPGVGGGSPVGPRAG